MEFSESSSSLRFYGKQSKRKWIGIAVLTFAVGIGIGVPIGWFTNDGSDSSTQPQPEGVCLGPNVPPKIIQDGEPEIAQKILENIKAENIRENLLRWTSYPHLGGTDGEQRLADELHDLWVSQGMDHVTQVQYDVLLSYPNNTDLSVIELIDDLGNVTFATQKVEKVIESADNNSNIVPPFNAYSGTGDAKGPLVYVNYGRVEDFEYLTRNLSMNLNGTIVIARYGKIFRADKVAFAEQYGALGCILYTDPADYYYGDDPSYPNSWWIPDTGVQRGTVYRFDGDPLTPGYPSTGAAYRLGEADAFLPGIPAHPISYGDALKFLEKMDGSTVDGWQGGLNISYNIGPGFKAPFQNWTVRMHITTFNARRNTTNVVGFIRGSVEPDRYVLLSNHRDAWVFGALDPTSGTAVMAEVSRVFTDLVKEGWRPRRSIIFASWGAEEYALVGSYEWVEHFIKTLQGRTVACLNVDIALQGNDSIRGLGVPLMYDLMYNVSKHIETPNKLGKTVFEEWMELYPGQYADGLPTGTPYIGQLGSGSDYASFIVVAGIPAADVSYDYNYTRWPVSSYPLYHSAYETFYLVEQYVDPEFKFSEVIGKFWAEMARQLADSLKLPLNATTYGVALGEYAKGLENGYGELMAANNVILDDLFAAIREFQQETVDFHNRMDKIDTTNPMLVRQFNDQLMHLERAFIDPEGLPTRPLYKHVLFAPSQHDAYSGATFPGLVDLLYDIEEHPENWETVRKHLAAIIHATESAARTLRDPWLFSG